jgi:two-component system, sensor histidine kinase and response regulator
MKRILVIEDEKEVRSTILELLENAGYLVISAEDGEQAINLLNKEIPDLIISDIMMPKIDGYQLLDYFRTLPSTSRVPFIFISAKIDNSDIRNGMNRGADDYITKPFRAKELLKSVESQLKKYGRVEKKIEEICLNISAYVPHELRTPLVSIMGYTDILQNEFELLQNNEIYVILDRIKSSSNRLHSTIENFMKYAEIQIRLSNNEKLDQQKIAQFSPFKSAELSCMQHIREANRESDLVLDLEDAEITVTENDFEFIVEEIMENALKFSNSGSNIYVKSYVKGKSYFLEITDNGKGMTPNQIADIHPFIQHDRDKFQQNGNGLGLISIKNLMDFYNGKLKIISEEDKFTTISLEFPLMQNN